MTEHQTKQPLRIAMIGYGFMGRAHSNAYRKVGNFFDLDYQPALKAACGRTKAKTEAFAYRWGYESVETDWKKLVARKDIDAVDICVPNDLHMEIAIAAPVLPAEMNAAALPSRTSSAATRSEESRLRRKACEGLSAMPTTSEVCRTSRPRLWAPRR